jgi:hypothetical protein
MNSNSYHLWNVDFHNHNNEVAAKHIAAQHVLHCHECIFFPTRKKCIQWQQYPKQTSCFIRPLPFDQLNVVIYIYDVPHFQLGMTSFSRW